MFESCVKRCPLWCAILLSGAAAGVFSTLVQVVLWLVFTDEFPAILFRDARLAAALVLGRPVLPPPATFDAGVMLVATLIHFALSLVYAAFIALLSKRLAGVPAVLAVLAGALSGVALYAVNLYGFTEIFPWFVQARGWIALAAHVAFGASAAFSFSFLHIRNARSQSGGH
jgi:hypothetical protein